MNLFTVHELAKILKVSEYTVCEWLKTGKIRGSKLCGKSWRVTEADLESFIRENEVKVS